MLGISDYNEPHTLDLQRMKNQMLMNQKNKMAMTQREKAPEVLMTKLEVKRFDIDNDRPDVIADRYKKQEALKAHAMLLTKNSIVDDLGFKPMKIKSATTQKMIDEYQAEQNAPVLLNGVSYKYHPTSVDLVMEKPNLNPTGQYTEAQLKNFKKIKFKDVIEHKKITNSLRDDVPIERRRLADQFNIEKAKLPVGNDQAVYDRLIIDTNHAKHNPELETVAKALGHTLIKKSIADRKAELLAVIKKQSKHATTIDMAFEQANDELDRGIDELKQRLMDIEASTAQIDRDIANNANIPHENRVEEERVKKINQQKLAMAVSDLKSLNTGMMVPDQQIGESEDDYRQRLIAIGTQEVDAETAEDNANLVNVVRAKGNLRDIISDEGTISTVIKKLSKDEIYIMNKKWDAIKKKYLETYGFNNKQVDDNDIVEFVQQMLAYAGGSDTLLMKVKPEAEAIFAEATPLDAMTDVEAIQTTAGDAIKFFALQQHGFKFNRGEGLMNVIANLEALGTQVPLNLIQNLRPAYIKKLQDAGFIGYYNGGGGGGADAGVVVGAGVGRGVSLHEYPRYIKLGAIHIEPASLYYHNILKIRGNKGRNGEHYRLVGLNDIKVSDILTTIIIKLTNGEKLTKYDINMLDEHDKMILDNLLIVAKLHKSHESTIDDTVSKLKNRYEILEGEMASGNNNPQLKKELYTVLHQMAHHKVITQGQAKKYLKEMNEIY